MTHCRPSMLHDLGCPVLLLNGQYDQFRLGTKESYRRACPGARVEIIRRAEPPLANLDQPEGLRRGPAALRRFGAGPLIGGRMGRVTDLMTADAPS